MYMLRHEWKPSDKRDVHFKFFKHARMKYENGYSLVYIITASHSYFKGFIDRSFFVE